MKDSRGEIIYVGKSKSLKKRVQSYFYNNKSHSPKVKKLVQHVKDLDYRVTDTEFEAFMLECQFIQEIKPMYNRKMKNPKGYSYIVVRESDGLRRLEVSNSIDAELHPVHFGPYTASRISVEKAVQGIQECFKIACNSTSSNSTPCLNHSLGLCLGMCIGGEPVQEYNEIMDLLIGLLDGSDRTLYKDMERKMLEASEQYDFEKAAKYRDYIESVKFLINKEKVIDFAEQNHNIAMIEPLNDGEIKLFLVKRNNILYCEKFSVECSKSGSFMTEVKERVLHYFEENPEKMRNEVRRDEIDTAQIIYSYLHHNNCHYMFIPQEWLIEENHDEIELALRKLLSQK
ncbi:excinuclease ABC subunit C [Fontibacillus solani]|uniref:Excinuclease ABC subunit C n=2 Tax=Fontibacillus solani TaxID=1572857 RepID=A0A7W3XSL5_9BACL|nr:UvrB/UvrC motif-containing protein [Fontibacillus solani]MBA9086660.1 excinuclease ABC subunit C [Fontibacillus solani]